MSKQLVPSLNGLRAISIGIVILFHCGFRSLGLANFPGGQFGVNIFFIVSGFLITLLLLEEEKASTTISLKKFYMRRIFRIFPAYYFLLLTYYILQATGVLHFTEHAWVAATTYSEDLPISKADDNWEMGHLWSLSVEEHFYLLWPIIFKFLKPYRVNIAAVLILIVPVVRGIEYAITPNDTTTTIFERADALMWGCLLAIYYLPASNWIGKNISRYWFGVFVPFIGLLVSVVGVKVFENNSPAVLGLSRALGRADGTFTDIFICMIIIISVNLKGSFAYKVLNFKIMNFIGKISYSLYIWQQLFFSHIQNRLFTFPFNISIIIIVAITSYYLIEKPFLRFKARFEAQRVPQNVKALNYQVEQDHILLIDNSLLPVRT